MLIFTKVNINVLVGYLSDGYECGRTLFFLLAIRTLSPQYAKIFNLYLKSISTYSVDNSVRFSVIIIDSCRLDGFSSTK